MSRNKFPLPTIAPPRVAGHYFLDLQKAFDDRTVSGVTQPKTTAIACTYQEVVNGRMHGCAGLAAVKKVDEEACPNCEKITKHVHDVLCLGHGALMVVEKLQSPQTSMFEEAPADDRDESAEEDSETVIDGATGAPIAPSVEFVEQGTPEAEHALEDLGRPPEEPTYAFAPMPEDPKLCVCGFEIASPVSGDFHDKRHANYLAASAEISDQERETAQRVSRKAVDITKAVSKRSTSKKPAGKKRGVRA